MQILQHARMSSDEVEQHVPRQRAVVACRFCRQRKRRCDGKRPVCSNCEAANVECRSDLETSLSVVGKRLDQLESVVGELSHALDRTAPASVPVAAPIACCSHSLHLHSQDVLPASPHGSGLSHITTPSGLPAMAMDTSPGAELPTMTIPLWHSTTTGSLISCPQVKALLGDYPNDVFLRIEERRTLPTSLELPSSTSSPLEMPVLDHAITSDLMEKYFQSVNIQHPIIDYDECVEQYHSITSNPLERSLESALFLLMLALAEVAGTPPPEVLDANRLPGSTYFLLALTISVEAYLKTSLTTIVLPRCLYLAALYYNYLGRPLDAWKLVHMASTSFQRLWIKSKSVLENDEMRCQPFIRLCWAIFVLECDLIAEHHLPRSGVENLVDKLNLPLCGDPPNASLLAWLAELSARRLLNRVHHAMYEEGHEYLLQANYVAMHASDGHDDETIHRAMSSSLKISTELDGQLNNWFNLIPHIIKPGLTQPPVDTHAALMVLRYHSAKDIIFRPFLLFACSLPPTLRPPQSLIETCQTVIHSCRQYIHAAEIRLREPSASTEIVIHSIFASTIIITIAALNPWLEEHVSDIDTVQALAISTTQRWAFPGSCIEAMTLMLRAMQNKTNILRAGLT